MLCFIPGFLTKLFKYYIMDVLVTILLFIFNHISLDLVPIFWQKLIVSQAVSFWQDL